MRRFRFAVWGLVLCLSMTSTAVAVGAEPTKPTAERPLAELRIDGEHIETLRLRDADGRKKTFARPGDVVHLPPGSYYLDWVKLEGGFECHVLNRRAPELFEVTVDEPYTLQVGAPLLPTASVTRQGKYLEIEYDLVDAQGRSYSQRLDRHESFTAPKFVIRGDGQELLSGSFAYG